MNDLWKSPNATELGIAIDQGRPSRLASEYPKAWPVLGVLTGVMLMLSLAVIAILVGLALRTDWLAITEEIVEYAHLITRGSGSMFATGP